MKAKLTYWHKARLHGRFIVEMKIHDVGKSSKYPTGIKYGLICKDIKSDKRVLMDNHHPKGPHVHLDEVEATYEFRGEDALFSDFASLVFQHLGVKL